MDKQITVLIAGGGTGGHLYPAIAIGETILSKIPSSQIHFMGSTFGIEAQVLPVKGLPHTLLPVRGLQRSFNLQSLGRNVLLPWRLIKSLLLAKRTIKQLNPDIVVGTGGYASAMPLKIAVKRGIPIILQEQNSFPGITTKYYADDAQIICVAFKDAKKQFGDKAVITGNPIRASIISGDRKKSGMLFDLNPEQKTIFLFGGSQGSAFLNEIISNCISMFESEKIQILWQTGENQYNDYKIFESSLVKVKPFIDHMAEAYAISDLIISRAGALTLAEITVCGKPSILVPFPHSAGDHQTKNARSVQMANAALLLEEKGLSSRKLYRSAIDILYDDSKLEKMSANSKKIGIPDATDRIVNHIFKVIKK